MCLCVCVCVSVACQCVCTHVHNCSIVVRKTPVGLYECCHHTYNKEAFQADKHIRTQGLLGHVLPSQVCRMVVHKRNTFYFGVQYRD